jgi:hypothetical protein
MRTAFWLESVKKKYPEDLGVDERTLLKWILSKSGWWLWIGFVWLRIGSSDELL